MYKNCMQEVQKFTKKYGSLVQNTMERFLANGVCSKSMVQSLKSRAVFVNASGGGYTLHVQNGSPWNKNKEITLSLRWPRDAPNMWVPWKL